MKSDLEIKAENIMDPETVTAAQIATSLTSYDYEFKIECTFQNVFLVQATKLGMLLIFSGPLPTTAPRLII